MAGHAKRIEVMGFDTLCVPCAEFVEASARTENFKHIRAESINTRRHLLLVGKYSVCHEDVARVRLIDGQIINAEGDMWTITEQAATIFSTKLN